MKRAKSFAGTYSLGFRSFVGSHHSQSGTLFSSERLTSLGIVAEECAILPTLGDGHCHCLKKHHPERSEGPPECGSIRELLKIWAI